MISFTCGICFRPENIQGWVIERRAPVGWRAPFETGEFRLDFAHVVHACLDDLAEGKNGLRPLQCHTARTAAIMARPGRAARYPR